MVYEREMKRWMGLGLAVVLAGCVATGAVKKGASRTESPEGMRFIFFAVLEGLYEDGVSNEDVDRILARKDGSGYRNFIFGCEICTATIQALEAYRARPDRLYGRKIPSSTFGPGLPPAVRERLRSPDSKVRLRAINGLVRSWIQRRMERMNLSRAERARLREEINWMRDRGMQALESFRKNGTVDMYAASYVEVSECAACNGAAGLGMP